MAAPVIIAAEPSEAPKRQRKQKVEAIVPVEPEVRLGSLAIASPRQMISQATELASVLAEVINSQKLFTQIQGKKYVLCEGWTTLAAMLGVTPVEEYCRPLPQGNGFEAKVNLVRGKDGAIIGSASAECNKDEKSWKTRDSYSLRSMALTRATGKACRLTFSWIMKLAGFQPTPAEEMHSEEDASVIRQEVEEEVERQKGTKAAATCIFYTKPEKYNGHFTEFININEFGAGLDQVAQEGLKALIKKYVSKKTEAGSYLVPAEKLDAFLHEFNDCGIDTKQLKAAE